MTPLLQQKIVLRPDVLRQDVFDDGVLLDLKSESYFALNSTGLRMFDVVLNSSSIQAACDALLLEYSVQPDQLANDLLTLVKTLVDHDLVDVIDP